MNRFAPLAALALSVLTSVAPALADTTPVQDGAGLFSASTVAQLNQQIGNFTAQTGKQIVVVTVPSLNGNDLQSAAQTVFQQQSINGILIFIAKDDRRDIIVPGPATAQFFPEPTIVSIRQSMESQFKDEDYDGGITTAVNGILNVFRAHMNSANAPAAAGGAANYPAVPATTTFQRRGSHVSVFTIILFIVIGYFVLRSIMRSMSGPRYGPGPGGPAPGGPAPGGPGYGGYGYGPGYYGGGGSFWSGLLGGLGGAWLGNEMFGGNRTIVQQPGGNVMPVDQGGSWGGGADAGGWGSDAGQADMGAASGGDWSGGGFGGGGFDGGGGGFGGGGDAGGGW